jgi:hypothetical protein
MISNDVLTYLEKKVEATRKIIWDKIILLKFIHHTQGAIGKKTW